MWSKHSREHDPSRAVQDESGIQREGNAREDQTAAADQEEGRDRDRQQVQRDPTPGLTGGDREEQRSGERRGDERVDGRRQRVDPRQSGERRRGEAGEICCQQIVMPLPLPLPLICFDDEELRLSGRGRVGV